MTNSLELKNNFLKSRDDLFQSYNLKNDPLKFSMEYSLLVEATIRLITAGRKVRFALASAGSFARRELSPYSDIDLMIIADSIEDNKTEITNLITALWDSGIEASSTIRELDDIQKYLSTDLHTFTQFFETRFILGNESFYKTWNKSLIESFNGNDTVNLLNELFYDIQKRYDKYGNSPKVLEPNIKMSAGGLRDLQAVEWMYMIANKDIISSQHEATQVEVFVDHMEKNGYTTSSECRRLLESYKFLLGVRNILHLQSHQRTDRFEFTLQMKLSKIFGYPQDEPLIFMKEYFRASTTINRFTKSMIKKFTDDLSNPIPASLAIELDDDFIMKGNTISYISEDPITMSGILRAFYYRGLNTARFDEQLRGMIIEYVENVNYSKRIESDSSVFFREILKLPKNVGRTLSVMNELGVLGAFIPEFDELNGFMQHGVYHCYTADEHTIMTIRNLENLANDNSTLGKIYYALKDREILHLGMLFHDIAKPINISGHEIIGVEMASSIMDRLGYSEEEINKVGFLVENHLIMEQVAFRRNLNDPETLNSFSAKFESIQDLDLLYLVTYADLSAVNPAVWTSWKSELLSELYRKCKVIIEDKISGEELLYSTTYVVPKEITKHSEEISEQHVQEHIDSINDISYTTLFTDEEIAKHIEEIQKGINISVLFKELPGYTNITVITKDYPSLLSKLCGVLTINDANIHDAKIFTRKDGIVIDTFNVTDFRTHKPVDTERYSKIKKDFNSVVAGLLQLPHEVAMMKSKWWRIESKFFKRSGQVKIAFEEHERYTIIDIFSPDRIGFLYHVTSKMNELGLIIYFAKISTKGDDIVDSFYVLDRNNKKVSQNDFELIKSALTETITQIL
ncbi:MAG: HD domain-containing protein [Ignavibacteriaceae bacterium]